MLLKLLIHDPSPGKKMGNRGSDPSSLLFITSPLEDLYKKTNILMPYSSISNCPILFPAKVANFCLASNQSVSYYHYYLHTYRNIYKFSSSWELDLKFGEPLQGFFTFLLPCGIEFPRDVLTTHQLFFAFFLEHRWNVRELLKLSSFSFYHPKS